MVCSLLSLSLSFFLPVSYRMPILPLIYIGSCDKLLPAYSMLSCGHRSPVTREAKAGGRADDPRPLPSRSPFRPPQFC